MLVVGQACHLGAHVMNSASTKKMVALVEEQTGFRVTLDVVSGIYENAQMISARPETPAHIIRVNAERQAHADYIVAVQCAMLLVLWSDPTKVPSFVPDESKCAFLAGKWAKAKELRGLPARIADQTATLLMRGLLQQLQSMPLEIRVTNFCFEKCPDLREMQAESVGVSLRKASQVLSPEVKNRSPEEVFNKNVAMNAALVLNWARLSGSRIALLPYESTGRLDAGQRLLAALDAMPAADAEIHVRTVDAWAEQLKLRTLYQWEFTNRRL